MLGHLCNTFDNYRGNDEGTSIIGDENSTNKVTPTKDANDNDILNDRQLILSSQNLHPSLVQIDLMDNLELSVQLIMRVSPSKLGIKK